MITPAAAGPDISSALIADSEPVFQSSPLMAGVPVPVFGDRVCWPAGCLPRSANRRPSQWRIDFPDSDAVWNLRLREIAFALLNPAHPSIRAAGVFRKADPMALSSVVLAVRKLSVLAAWAAARSLPHDLTAWRDEDFDTFLADTRQRAAPSTLSQYVVAIRVLRDLASVLTHGGLDRDPWPRRTSADVAKSTSSDDLATPVIPPQAWWPLLRAAWTYVHTFAPDLLSLRDRLEREEREQESATDAATRTRRTRDETNLALSGWLFQPGHVIPVRSTGHHYHGYGHRDPSWAKEMDSEFEQAAARRLIGLLRDRQAGNRIAVGPGAARLHDGLDAVIATAGAEPQARALLADERTLTTLLRGQFADLHWGTLNHCLWNASTAECQNTLPEDQRGQGPLLGACQPARCRNSAVTAKHLPIWLAEEQDLQRMLTEPRLGPARRESLQNRLADVQLITSTWHDNQPDPEGTTP